MKNKKSLYKNVDLYDTNTVVRLKGKEGKHQECKLLAWGRFCVEVKALTSMLLCLDKNDNVYFVVMHNEAISFVYKNLDSVPEYLISYASELAEKWLSDKQPIHDQTFIPNDFVLVIYYRHKTKRFLLDTNYTVVCEGIIDSYNTVFVLTNGDGSSYYFHKKHESKISKLFYLFGLDLYRYNKIINIENPSFASNVNGLVLKLLKVKSKNLDIQLQLIDINLRHNIVTKFAH